MGQSRRRLLPYSIFLASSCGLLVNLVFFLSSLSLNSPTYLSVTPTTTHSGDRHSARHIVERAYNKTYKVLVDQCSDTSMSMRECIKAWHQQKTDYAWWFETMLRDAAFPGSGLFGYWHLQNLQSSSHTVQFCNMEKVACTEWRALRCLLDGYNSTTKTCANQKPQPTPPKLRAVFLRDPLERFLSGFINKCLQHTWEGHCEPQAIHRPELQTPNSKRTDAVPPLVQELAIHNHRYFEAYVDTIPLKWNLHFFPSSLYCDGLFRHLDGYDFVGHMGTDFHDQLRAFGRRYNMMGAVQQAFYLENETSSSLQQEKFVARKQDRSSKTAQKMLQFYSPSTLRRVLEYLSIDYMLLGLPIPEWAEEMLQQDE